MTSIFSVFMLYDVYTHFLFVHISFYCLQPIQRRILLQIYLYKYFKQYILQWTMMV